MTAQTIVEDGAGRFDAHEHRDLALGMTYIAETVERATELSATDLWSRLHRSLAWLTHDLRPHMVWEDATLYPAIDERAGTPWATRFARSEHRQIETLIAALETDSAIWLDHRTPRTCADIVSHLSAIRAVIAGHIEREERILLPVLEAAPGPDR
jgi:iron-sulfur cluster repair protein YtfE (RIC family)